MKRSALGELDLRWRVLPDKASGATVPPAMINTMDTGSGVRVVNSQVDRLQVPLFKLEWEVLSTYASILWRPIDPPWATSKVLLRLSCVNHGVDIEDSTIA